MSFILDALKKSEAERQQKNTPGIASIPEGGRPRTASKWAWIIGVLLAANLAAIAYIMLEPGSDELPARQDQAGTTGTLETQTEDAEAIPAPRMEQPSQAVVQTSPPAPVETSREDPTMQPATREPDPVPTVADGLASFNELRAQGILQLPDLHLDIHVYSGTPAERFVFVNMSKYTENSTLAEGPTVREITPDGVVLDYLGTPFLLPRE